MVPVLIAFKLLYDALLSRNKVFESVYYTLIQSSTSLGLILKWNKVVKKINVEKHVV